MRVILIWNYSPPLGKNFLQLLQTQERFDDYPPDYLIDIFRVKKL
jgi:hypothetical protein